MQWGMARVLPRGDRLDRLGFVTFERDIGSLLLGVRRTDLQPSEIQGLLLRAAKYIGTAPAIVTGPGPTACWRLGERGCTIEVKGRANGTELVFTTFDWLERDGRVFRQFKWSEGAAVPFWWSLPVQAGHDWYADVAVVDWASFFAVFRRCWNDLPSELALLPAAWIRSGDAAISRWMVDGVWKGQLAVAVSVAGVAVTGLGTSEIAVQVPADRLGERDVDVPAIVAGLTSGAFTDLAFIENETVMEMFPVGGNAATEGDENEFEAAFDGPNAAVSVSQIQARLAAPAFISPAQPAPSAVTVDSEKSFVPVLSATDAVKLARLLSQHNDKAASVVGQYDAALAKAGKSSLEVRLRPRRTGPVQGVWVCLGRSAAGAADLHWALGYGNQLRDHLTQQIGVPATLRVGSVGTVSRLWRVGEAGLLLRVEPRQVNIEIDDFDLLHLGQLGLL